MLIAGSFVPPAIAGLALERPIEQRLGTPRSIAAGLIAGAATLVAADRSRPRHRRRDDATIADALALGLAQACALVPGVSRNGATLAAGARCAASAARTRTCSSRHVALPVIVGATAAEGHAPGPARPAAASCAGAFAVGAGASFASTLASVRRDPRGRARAPVRALGAPTARPSRRARPPPRV